MVSRQSANGAIRCSGVLLPTALLLSLIPVLIVIPAGVTMAQVGSAGELRELSWEELLPPGETERLEALYREYLESRQQGDGAAPRAIPEGGAGDFMPQLGTFETVAALDGLMVRLPGFVVPLDFSKGSRHEHFLLVPYFGACIHTPPPPPNQLIYVTAQPAAVVENIWEPVWVVGRLHAQRRDTSTGNAAYTLDLARLEPYGD